MEKQNGKAVPALRHAARVALARARSKTRRGLRRGGAALNQWALPDNNPFLRRATRGEARRHKPLFTLVIVFTLALALNIAFWIGLDHFQQSFRYRYVLARYSPLYLGPAFGKNAIGLAAILTAAVSALGAISAVHQRAASVLRQELFGATLPQLQLLPVAEERWLWQMCAHPTAISLLICCAGFPIYFLAIALGLWSWLDLLGLLLVFALLGHSAPGWQPLLWKQSARGAAKPDIKAQQARLRELNCGVKLAQMSPAAQMEHARKVQRALAGLDGEVAGDAADNAKSEKSGGGLFGARKANSSGWGRAIWFYFGIQFLAQMLIGARRGGWSGAVWREVASALPRNVSELAPGIAWTWPLMIARLLFAPLPFFAFSLMPVLLLVPLIVTQRRQSFLTLASQVSTIETFWTRRRLRLRRALAGWLWLLLALFVFGYGWRALVESGEAVNALPGALPSPENALAVLWTIAIVGATMAAGTALEKPFAAAIRDEILPRDAWRQSLGAMIVTFCAPLLCYFVFCWLGARSGGGELWLQRLAPTLCTGAAFLLADFGAAAVGVALSPGLRTPWKWLRLFWFGWFAIEAGVRLFAGNIRDVPFGFEQAPHVLLSPFVSLLALFRLDLSSGAAWWLGPAWQSLAGALCLAFAAPKILGKSTSEFGRTFEGASLWDKILDALFAPFRLIGEILGEAWKLVADFFKAIGARLARFDDKIIARGEAFDNAVLTGELRSRVRRQKWTAQWLTLAFIAASLLVSAGQPWTLIGASAGWRADWSSVVVWTSLFVMCLLAFLGVADIGRSFDRDRANGTLVFLFLTPMSDAALIVGKIAPPIVFALGLLATLMPISIIGALVGLAGGDAIPLVIATCGTVFALSLLALSASVQAVFAARAVKPGTGSGKAVVLCIAIEIALAVSLLWATDALMPNMSNEVAAVLICIAAIIASVIHVLLSRLAWRLALWSLRRARYGDVTALGKGVS